MDYVEDKLASEFVFNNPNIKGVCGCGESFHLQNCEIGEFGKVTRSHLVLVPAVHNNVGVFVFSCQKKEGIIWFKEYLTHFEDVSYKTDIPNLHLCCFCRLVLIWIFFVTLITSQKNSVDTTRGNYCYF